MGEKRARAYDDLHEQYSKRTKETHDKSMTEMLRFAGDSQRNLLQMATIMQPGSQQQSKVEGTQTTTELKRAMEMPVAIVTWLAEIGISEEIAGDMAEFVIRSGADDPVELASMQTGEGEDAKEGKELITSMRSALPIAKRQKCTRAIDAILASLD